MAANSQKALSSLENMASEREYLRRLHQSLRLVLLEIEEIFNAERNTSGRTQNHFHKFLLSKIQSKKL